MEKKAGAPRKYDYKGDKRNFTIRLTEQEVKKIKKIYSSVQAFVQESLGRLK